MFRGQGPFIPEDTGERVQPKPSIVEATEGVISYPQSRITAPLGGDGTGIMEALALTTQQVDPRAYKEAAASIFQQDLQRKLLQNMMSYTQIPL